MKKEKSMIEYQQNRKDATIQKVKDMIRKTKRNKKPLTKTQFCKQAGVSLQYLYKYPDLLAEVSAVCIQTGRKKTKQNSDSKDTIITSLRAENKALKIELPRCRASRILYVYRSPINYKELEFINLPLALF